MTRIKEFAETNLEMRFEPMERNQMQRCVFGKE